MWLSVSSSDSDWVFADCIRGWFWRLKIVFLSWKDLPYQVVLRGSLHHSTQTSLVVAVRTCSQRASCPSLHVVLDLYSLVAVIWSVFHITELNQASYRIPSHPSWPPIINMITSYRASSLNPAREWVWIYKVIWYIWGILCVLIQSQTDNNKTNKQMTSFFFKKWNQNKSHPYLLSINRLSLLHTNIANNHQILKGPWCIN